MRVILRVILRNRIFNLLNMKRFIVAAMALLLLQPINYAVAKVAGDELPKAIESASKVKDAEYLKIGKTLLRLMAMGEEGDQKEFLKSLNQIQMLSLKPCEAEKRDAAVEAICAVLASYEVVASGTEDGMTVKAYVRQDPEGNYTSLLVYCVEEFTFMAMYGKISPDHLQSAMDMADDKDTEDAD